MAQRVIAQPNNNGNNMGIEQDRRDVVKRRMSFGDCSSKPKEIAASVDNHYQDDAYDENYDVASMQAHQQQRRMSGAFNSCNKPSMGNMNTKQPLSDKDCNRMNAGNAMHSVKPAAIDASQMMKGRRMSFGQIATVINSNNNLIFPPITHTLIKCKDRSWSKRVDGLHEISKRFEMGDPQSLSKIGSLQFNEIISILEQSMGDNTPQVAEAALETFAAILKHPDNHRGMITAIVLEQRLLPIVLLQLSNPKYKVKLVAEQSLNASLRSFPLETIASVLTRIFIGKKEIRIRFPSSKALIQILSVANAFLKSNIVLIETFLFSLVSQLYHLLPSITRTHNMESAIKTEEEIFFDNCKELVLKVLAIVGEEVFESIIVSWNGKEHLQTLCFDIASDVLLANEEVAEQVNEDQEQYDEEIYDQQQQQQQVEEEEDHGHDEKQDHYDETAEEQMEERYIQQEHYDDEDEATMQNDDNQQDHGDDLVENEQYGEEYDQKHDHYKDDDLQQQYVDDHQDVNEHIDENEYENHQQAQEEENIVEVERHQELHEEMREQQYLHQEVVTAEEEIENENEDVDRNGNDNYNNDQSPIKEAADIVAAETEMQQVSEEVFEQESELKKELIVEQIQFKAMSPKISEPIRSIDTPASISTYHSSLSSTSTLPQPPMLDVAVNPTENDIDQQDHEDDSSFFDSREEFEDDSILADESGDASANASESKVSSNRKSAMKRSPISMEMPSSRLTLATTPVNPTKIKSILKSSIKKDEGEIDDIKFQSPMSNILSILSTSSSDGDSMPSLESPLSEQKLDKIVEVLQTLVASEPSIMKSSFDIERFANAAFPLFSESLRSSNPDIRKRVVTCFIELSFLVPKEVLDAHMQAHLASSHRKLVDIFIRKANKNL